MASVKNLKKDINYTLGDLIDACLVWQISNPDNDASKSEAIVDETIIVFDDLIQKLNQKNVENKKSHFKAISSLLQEKATQIANKINSL